jgi:hypothetical protein
MQAIRPSIEDDGNGGVFVHLHDECTNQRKAIRRSDPVHHWGNRFSILYISLEQRYFCCEDSWLRNDALKEWLLESAIINSISNCK